MKRLIISLGIMAIANLTLILPVKANLVSDGEMYKARDYLLWTQNQNRNIYAEYDIKEVIMFLADQSCQKGSFDRALEVLKSRSYTKFVATILIYNENYRLQQLVKLLTDSVCPEVEVKY